MGLPGACRRVVVATGDLLHVECRRRHRGADKRNQEHQNEVRPARKCPGDAPAHSGRARGGRPGAARVCLRPFSSTVSLWSSPRDARSFPSTFDTGGLSSPSRDAGGSASLCTTVSDATAVTSGDATAVTSGAGGSEWLSAIPPSSTVASGAGCTAGRFGRSASCFRNVEFSRARSAALLSASFRRASLSASVSMLRGSRRGFCRKL